MLKVLNDTCHFTTEYIRHQECHLKKTTMAVVADEIRYDIARAKAKLKHYEQMYKELKKYGYVVDKEAMDIELDEKLEKIEKAFRYEPEEEESILGWLEDEE